MYIQGGPLFLSQTWGEFLDSVFFFTPLLGLCFWGGGKNSGPPCVKGKKIFFFLKKSNKQTKNAEKRALR